MSTSVLLTQIMVWALCTGALAISYWNYSRYVEAKSDPDESKRYLQIALHVRRDASIGEAEFKKIESSHYRPYLNRFRIGLIVGLIFGAAGLIQLLV